MTADEIRNAVFEALHHRWVENREEPEAFVGLQGDKIVVMQKGGEHYVIAVVPATVAVAS